MIARGAMRNAALVAAAVATASAAGGAPNSGPAVLHERIPPNPGEDLAMHVLLDGNLPGAIQTPMGAIAAPDPQALPAASDSAYGPSREHDLFQPDRDTRRPEVRGYEDPFTPATAPFKRLAAFDAVHDDYTLYVRDAQRVGVTPGATPGSDDDVFFADVVVDLAPEPGERALAVRIPSVGPGARVVRARLGLGPRDVPLRVARDGADNWFLETDAAAGATPDTLARLVMELSIPRAALGGPLADPSWNDLPFVAREPDNVVRDAAVVTAAIGISRRMRPRQAIASLVRYFREFTDSNEPPPARGNVYLDLALSKKGVCRHRAFAFLVTAESLGIPTRMVLNEAHAWVEVHDGTLWRGIDLGGAGEFDAPPDGQEDRVHYDAPADAFSWPAGSDRGDRMLEHARARAASTNGGANGPEAQPTATTDRAAPRAENARAGQARMDSARDPVSEVTPSASDARPVSSVRVAMADGAARRGKPLRVQGAVEAAGQPCPHVAVDLWLRDVGTGRLLFLGTLATDDDGAFAGGVVVPATVALGDYTIVARTTGDSVCGASAK
jgi:transglutaminase-like putative cysteine protease